MRRYFMILLISALISACGLFDITVDQEQSTLDKLEKTVVALSSQNAQMATQIQQQGTAVALATYVPYISTQVMGLRLPPTPPGGFPPTPSPLLPPKGLIYGTSDGLWLIDESGQPTRILDRRDVVLSPDGYFGLFLQYDSDANTDLWSVMIGTGEKKNLSNSPDQTELFGMWWPGQPDKVIFGSRPTSEEPVPSTGHLSMLSVETGEYQILDGENISNAYPAPSPDGQRIAYDRSGSPWIYDLVNGPEAFDLDAFDFYVAVGSQQITLASPSWSPDGTHLAWVMGGGLAQDASYRIGIAIFDLETETAILLHPYIPIGRGGWPPAPVWSSDGQWLTFNTSSQEEPNGLWVARPDGSDENFLGTGSDPVWSPDGSRLAFNRYEDQHSVWIVRVGEWKPEQVYLPPDSSVSAWLPLD